MIWNPLIVSPGNASPYWCSPFCVSLTCVTVHAQCSLTPYWEILRPLAQFEPFPALGSGIPALVGAQVGTTLMSLKQWWLMTARPAWIYGPRLNMESLVFSSVCHFFSSSGPFLQSLWYFCLFSPFHASELPLISSILYYVLFEFTYTSIHPSVAQSIYYTERNDRSMF